MGKMVPASKFTELKGLDRIAQTVHAMKCLFREISKDDFGLDGEIEVVVPKADDKGFETTGGIIKVQAKSGESYVKRDSERSFVTPVSTDDLQYWNGYTFPVFFIVYHPQDDRLYFKEVQEYIRSTPNVFQAPTQIQFDKQTDEFTAEKRDSVCRYANVSPPRIAFGQKERLLSTLLPIRMLPKWLYHAPTRRKSWRKIRDEVEGFCPPGTIVDGRLYSLGNLFNRDCILRNFCGKRIKRTPTQDWIADELRRRDFVFLLNQLLGIHLYGCGIRYNRDFQRNYFPRRNDTDKEFKQEWTSVRTGKPARPRTVAKYYEYASKSDTIRFWRHLAAEIDYRQVGQSWFLQIIPRYFFTDDGEKPWDSELVGPYTTMLKAMEHNIQVLNHVLFWSDVISKQQPQIEMQLSGTTILRIEKLPVAGIAQFGIPDDPATYEERSVSNQLSLLDSLDMGEDGDEQEDDEY